MTTTEQRRQHPFADEFTNEWAWNFERGFNGLAAKATDSDEFLLLLAEMHRELHGHKPEMGRAWLRFCARKLNPTTTKEETTR